MTTLSPPDTDRSRRLISQCLHIARVYDEEYPRFVRHGAADGYRTGGVNPIYNQTTSGLYLEFYYGFPSQLWTPWGTWTFHGQSSSRPDETADQLNTGFLSRLTLELHRAEYFIEHVGSFGPVYAVTAIDGDPVEPAGEIFANGPYSGGLTSNDAEAEWALHGGPYSSRRS